MDGPKANVTKYRPPCPGQRYGIVAGYRCSRGCGGVRRVGGSPMSSRSGGRLGGAVASLAPGPKGSIVARGPRWPAHRGDTQGIVARHATKRPPAPRNAHARV